MAQYEILVVGGGPAGYTAALYAARSGRKTAVVEKLSPGGQMATTSVIDNYPGFPDGVDGFELGEKMEQQARKYGAETVYAEVTGADLTAVPKVLHTSEGDLTADAAILPQGTGYLTDAGMTGVIDSVLGVKPEIIIGKLKTKMPARFDLAKGPCKMDCVLFSCDEKTGHCTGVEQLTLT